MSRILIVFTGGTISMKLDPVTGGAVPALSGREIIAFDPGLSEVAELDVIDHARLPGPHWTPARMFGLSELLHRELESEDIAGAVVTHGTDTLEETAYFSDLRHSSSKPVVFTGAMRNASELGYDGPANLRAAVRVAADPGSASQGVLIVLNQMIHAASAATKSDTQAVETFHSPVFGPLGMVDNDGVRYFRALPSRLVLQGGRFEEHVDLLQMYAGADSRFIDFSRQSGARGIVIEGTGRGNVPPAAIPGIQRFLDAGLPVVIASRCAQGRVLDTYAYEGAGRDLRKRGALFAGTLTGAKARIRLMIALGCAAGPGELRELFEAGSY